MSENNSDKNPSWNKNYQVKHQGKANVQQLFNELRTGDRNALARAITLIESSQPEDAPLQLQLMEACLPFTGKSKRIGITGIPGAGKSTFIEVLGLHICNQNLSLAVLAVDPSSARSGGSILGDKTRMAELSVNDNAFIRPSPGGDSLGGIAAHTRETLLLCEAAGFDVVIIETIGVGQSETWVRSITDLFLLLTIPNAGDELQGIKRGIMEMADMVIINKADGDMLNKAKQTRQQLLNALHLFPLPDSHVPVEVAEISSLEKKGIDTVWKMIESYFNKITVNGWKENLRKTQEKEWLHRLLEREWAKMSNTFVSEEEWKLIENRINTGQSGIYTEAATILSHMLSRIRKNP